MTKSCWERHKKEKSVKKMRERRGPVDNVQGCGLDAPDLQTKGPRDLQKNSYDLRDSENKPAVPLPRANYYRNSFCYSRAVLWNNLPTDERQAKSLSGFLKLLTSSSNTAFIEKRP